MARRTFVAFSSTDPLVADTIVESCKRSHGSGAELEPWNRNDVSGQQIHSSVFAWVESADAIVADVSEPNHNVTYEIGLALGMAKPLRLVRARSKDRRRLEEIGLLHIIGPGDYDSITSLAAVLGKPIGNNPWTKQKRNREAPLYVLQSSAYDDLLRKTTSAIKKTLKLRYRNFNPREIDRLTAGEAFEQVSQSFGVVAIWHEPDAPEAFRQNQRAAFAIGLARGLDVPFLLLAEKNMRLPLDLDEVATRWAQVSGPIYELDPLGGGGIAAVLSLEAT